MIVTVKSRDENIGRENEKLVQKGKGTKKLTQTMRKQFTRQIQLSCQSGLSAPLEFYMIYLKGNQSAWLEFFPPATFICLYVSTELMVG